MGYGNRFKFTSDPYSGYDRLRVDEAQTSFFEGREFRVFQELTLSGGATKTYRVAPGCDIVLYELAVESDSGWLRVETLAGGSATGTFSETITPIGANLMTASGNRRRKPNDTFYATATAVTAATDAVVTGATTIDIFRLKTSTNSGQASSVGAQSQAERGAAAGTYYIRLTNLDSNSAASCVIRARWEERPVGAFN
jgi:hypothetical protein